MEKDDVELIQNILAGDEAAFSTLVKKYQKGVHALAWRKVKDYHIAEEITQDAFLQAHKKLASLKDPRLFPGWLYVIADRLCRAWFRKKQLKNIQSIKTTCEETLEKTAYANYVCEQREETAVEHQRQIVQRLMAKLPESERTVMVLYYLGEMNCGEISKFLGVSPHTVKSRLRRARERLKNEEHILRETLGGVPLSPHLTENIMRNIDPLKQTSSSGGKPLLPLAALGSSVILVILLMGASRQITNNFQQPYSLDAQSEPTIEIIDAPIVLKSQSKRDLQNRVGNRTTPDKNSNDGLSEGTESMQSDIAEDVTRWNLPEKAKARFGKGRVRELTYFPDGTRLAVWSTIGIWIYDVRTGAEIELFAQDAAEAIGMALSPDGQTFAFTRSDKNIYLWDLQMKRETNVFTGHTSFVSSLAFSPTGEILASGGYDATVRLWDVRTGELLRTLVGHTDGVMSVVYSPDGKTLASVSNFVEVEDNRVCLWNVQTGQLLQTITELPRKVYPVAYSPDSLTLVSGSRSRDSKIRFWDVGTGELIKTIPTDMASVTSVVYSPDGGTLASGSRGNKNIYLWDVDTGELLKTLVGHTDQVGSLVYAPDGKTLVSESEDGTVRFWDPHTGELLKTISGYTFFARSVAFAPDGGTLVSSEGADKTIVLRDVQTGKTLKTLVDRTDSAGSVKYSPDRWWLRSTGSHSVKYSPDGKIIASGSWDGPIRLWDVQTGGLLRTLIGHKEGAPSIAYSPDGTVLISGSWDNTIRFWDLHTGELMRTLTGNTTDVEPRQGVRSISLSRDGQTLAAATDENVIRLWDAHTGDVKATLTGHTDAGIVVAFSPNKSLLASGSEDWTIRLWNTTTGELLLTFPEQRNYVMSIAFSPDGQRIACGSWREVYISDLATGKSIATLTGHGEWVRSVAFSPDGQVLASGSDDGTVMLWDMTQIQPQND